MTYDNLKSLLATAPVIKLLRARNAALVLSFLYRSFKEQNQIVRTQYELLSQLSDFLEYLNDEDLRDESGTDYQTIAADLLHKWCDEDHLYLRRYLNEGGEAVLELTTHTEKAFQWMDLLQKREFVGAESRFRNIVLQLQEIIDNTSEDPAKKLSELEEKKREINAQIKRLKKTGKVNTYNDTQIKERFFNLSRTARELIADFKEVEQNFRDISLNIYRQQASRQVGKGKILSYTLDATDELKNSDQGKSFYAFWQFLIADNRQDEMRQMIHSLYDILTERAVEANDPFLKKIKFHLHNAGKKVIDSNHTIAEKLSRTLAERNLAERQRTRELINEIKQKAIEKIGHLQGRRKFINIEGWPQVSMVMDRPLGEPEQITNFAHQPTPVSDDVVSEADISAIFEQFEMNRLELEQRITELLRHQQSIRLEEVVRRFPVTRGLAELITYLSIASFYTQHRIDQTVTVPISWKESKVKKALLMPEVVFSRSVMKSAQS